MLLNADIDLSPTQYCNYYFYYCHWHITFIIIIIIVFFLAIPVDLAIIDIYLDHVKNVDDDDDEITGSAVALHCCKAHVKINTKIENSTPCKIVTHGDFDLKLGTRDYVGDTTHHATLGPNRPSGGFPPNRGNITPV